ncbi:MAG: sugar phosphate isomerase/epimerase [Clostridia bacterium]|nr:sugar phosphate isomerase/epimerase [Clostridia bacterium]
MKIGIRLHDTIEGTLEQRLAFVKGQGFECAHLALSKTLPDFAMTDAPEKLARPEFAEIVRGAFDRTEEDCAVLGCYLNLTHPDPEEREKTREIYYAHLAFAKKIGAWMVGSETPVHPKSPLAPEATTSEEAFRFFLNQLRPIVRRAEEEDVIMAIEPVYTHIVSTPERAERMLTELNSDHLRIILDAVNLLGEGNLDRREEVLREAMSRLGDRVALLHMKDYLRQEGLPAVPCGQGEMDYSELMAFARARDLSMTLENTAPENAEAAKETLLRS